MDKSFTNSHKETQIYLTHEGGKYYYLNEELIPLTKEQKKISKTKATHSFTMKDSEALFLCHLNLKNSTLILAETINKGSHTV